MNLNEKDPKNWVYGFFYFNKNDSRIFVPKRVPWTGRTLNFANPYSYLFLIIIILIIVLLSHFYKR